HRLHQVRARPRIDRPRRAFRPRAQEHAGAGHHGGRHPDRHAHRVLDHHRDRIPVARHGPPLHPISAIRGCADHDRLSRDGRAHLRDHQLHGRRALCHDRPAAARRTRGGGAGMNANRLRAGSLRGRWARLRASDIYYSFRRSPTTIAATIVTLVFVLGAVFAPLLAPHTPFVPSSIDINDAFKPPAWSEGGDWRYLFGTDNQGRDMLSTIMYGGRTSVLGPFAAVPPAPVLAPPPALSPR